MNSLLKQKIIGIDFSDFSIELLCLEKGFFKPKLFSYSRCMLPPGVLSDGVVLHPTALAGILKKMLQDARPKPLKSGICVFSLPDSQVFIHEFIMPISMGGQKLRQAIVHEIHLKLPLRLDEIYFDYIIIEKDNDIQHILFYAAPSHIVEKYINVLLDAGLTTIAIDVESMSIGRSLLDERDRNKATLIADIGARYTNISVYDNTRISGIHIINRGGDTITSRISKELGIPKEEAEDKKKKAGLSFTGKDFAISEIAADEFKNIICEIKEIIQYYLYRKKKIVESIIVTGGCALTDGMQKFFQSHFWQEIEIRNPIVKLNLHDADMKNERLVLFSNVIGMALRGLYTYPHLHGINFLQKARTRSEQ